MPSNICFWIICKTKVPYLYQAIIYMMNDSLDLNMENPKKIRFNMFHYLNLTLLLLICQPSFAYHVKGIKSQNRITAASRINAKQDNDLPYKYATRFLFDPLSAMINGRLYCELQRELSPHHFISIGYGYHGLNENKIDKYDRYADIRKGRLLRLSYQSMLNENFYLRGDLFYSMFKAQNRKFETNMSGNFDVTEYTQQVDNIAVFLNVGFNKEFYHQFFVDGFLGLGLYSQNESNSNFKTYEVNPINNLKPRFLIRFQEDLGFSGVLFTKMIGIQSGIRVGYQF